MTRPLPFYIESDLETLRATIRGCETELLRWNVVGISK